MPEKPPHSDLKSSYANRVKVEIDSQRKWIELHFNDYPAPLLKLRLQALGFRGRKLSVAFRAEYTRERMDYGTALEQALPTVKDGPELNLEPSFQPLKANIEKKEFSLIKINLANSSVKSYLLFEPEKHRAELMATDFAQRTFGATVQSIAVFSGTRLREATLLFDEGKIIFPGGEILNEATHQDTAINMEIPKPKPYEIRDAYYDNYPWADPDNRIYSYIKRADFDSWIRQNYRGLPAEEIEEAWKFHLAKVSAEKKMERLLKDRPIQPYTAIYNKLLKVIPDLTQHLRAGTASGKSKLNSPGMMDLSYDFLYKEAEDQFVIALAHRFEQNGDLVDDPDMQIRVMPGRQLAEALTIQDQFGFKQVYFEDEGKKYVYPKIKKSLNSFLNQWLSNILEQGHRIILTKTPENLHEAEELAEEESISVFKQAYQLLSQVIPDFPHDNPRAITETLQTNNHRFTVVIGPSSSGSVSLNFTQQDADGLTIEVQYDGLVYSDSQEVNMSFELLDNYYQSHFDRDESEEEIDARGADVGEVLTGAFIQFLYELIDEHIVIELKPIGSQDAISALISTPLLSDYAETKFITPAKFKTLLPNIIIPAEAKEPFISEGFNQGGMNAVIDRSFAHLRALDDTNLHQATALELYYLLQSAHPEDIGLKPSRQSVLQECVNRGATLLQQLGYPTDLAYPYVNQYIGYHNVESLRQLLGERANYWWSPVEDYFPLADPQEGLAIIGELKAKAIQERDKLVNPKTNKPFGKNLEAFRSLEFDIRSLDKNASVITEFLNAQKQLGQSGQVKATGKVPVLAIYLTTKAHSRQADFSKSEIIHSWKDADAFVRAKIGIYSDVYYKVTWQDQYYIEGMMDIEPPDFFDRKVNLLGDHILTFYTNISRILPGTDPIYGDEKHIQDAKHMLEHYQFDDEEMDIGQDPPLVTSQFPVIIQGLENAYWTKEDEAYRVNKITINGVDYNQANLRKALLDKLEKLPIDHQVKIAEELARHFRHKQSLSDHEQSMVTIGKRGDARKRILLRAYVDDIIVTHDVWNQPDAPGAMEYLLNLLIENGDTLVDMPVSLKKATPEEPLKKTLTAHQINHDIERFIDEKDKDGDGFSENDKAYIARYSGSGGLSKQGADGRGILYEYYTPDQIVHKMWGLAFKFGYTDGRVLEPACGTGNFLKYVPIGAKVDAYETNHYAKRIAEILYPFAEVFEKPFESIFFAGNVHLKDNFASPSYSLIIGNPPYGEFTGKYAGMGEKKWTGALYYDHYFMLRGLDLLLSGGLLVLLIPSYFINSRERYSQIKEKLFEKATLEDAYRLPAGVFKTTDVGTDIIVLKRK